MSETKLVTVQIRLTQELLNRIDRYRLSLTWKPSRSHAMRFLMENAMAIIEGHDNAESKDS